MKRVKILHRLALAAAALGAGGCGAQPSWLAVKIAQIEQLPVAQPARAIHRVEYQGRAAYLVTPTCCDIPAELYEESGQLICYPFGGFAGGDGRCPGVSAVPTSAPLWQDKRVAKRDEGSAK